MAQRSTIEWTHVGVRSRCVTYELVEDYATIAHVVASAGLDGTVTRDPDDDEVIACALAAGAEAIVSGDDDLLALTEYRGILILNATEALNKIEEGA